MYIGAASWLSKIPTMNAATAATNGAKYAYSVFKNATAPSEIWFAIAICAPSPDGALLTRTMSTATIINAVMPPKNGTLATTSGVISSSVNTPILRRSRFCLRLGFECTRLFADASTTARFARSFDQRFGVRHRASRTAARVAASSDRDRTRRASCHRIARAAFFPARRR